MNNINQSYEKLVNLITKKEDLSEFFSEKHDYKAICKKAMDSHTKQEEGKSIVNALHAHLPLNDWFDKDSVFHDFIKAYQEEVFPATKYSWCMIIPEIRKCFTPEEKGKFVRLGLSLGDFPIAYHGSLDNDWSGTIIRETLMCELRRVASHSVTDFNEEHLQEGYLDWVKTQLFPKVSTTDQYFFMFRAFEIAVNDLRQISEISNLAEIELNPIQDLSFEKISKVEKDLKDCIKDIKQYLHFEVWPSNFKSDFINFITRTAASAASNQLMNKEKMEEFAEYLVPIIQYTELNKELNTSNNVEPKKLKI